MKDIKNYLHLYLPLPFMWVENAVPFRKGEFGILEAKDLQYWDNFKKPILKNIQNLVVQDLKEWETDIFDNGFEIKKTPYNILIDSNDSYGYMIEIYSDASMICTSKDNGENYPFNGGELFRHLLSKHFDLFCLIKNGLAIDAGIIAA